MIDLNVLIGYVEWDKNMLDILCPIDQVGARYNSNKYTTSISLVDQFRYQKKYNL